MNFFKDSKGKTVIAQKPNLPIIVWFFAIVFSKLPLNENLISLFEVVSFGAIFTWAWMEIFSGVNLFRRTLGALVMLFIIFNRVYNL